MGEKSRKQRCLLIGENRILNGNSKVDQGEASVLNQ